MDDLAINSRSYFLWNNTLGLVLAEKDANLATPVASLTKMMTALITIQQRQLDEMVEITPEMLQGLEEFAIVGLQAGQNLTVEELLYATLLPSAGDAAQALAISTSGSIAAFADLMNQKAGELGMEETHFSNPVGFDEENYSTPRDIALLLRAALKEPDFLKFFEAYEAGLPSINLTVQKTFAPQRYIKGGKTGYTDAAGRCLASTADVEGTEYILVTIGADPGENTVDADKIYNYIAENYEPTKLVSAGDKIVSIGVAGSPTKTLDFTASADVVVALPNDFQPADLVYHYDGKEQIEHQEVGDQVLGSWTISYQDNVLHQEEIYLSANCEDDVYCVEVPEFYNYSLTMIGVVVSLVALISVIVGSLRKKKRLQIISLVVLVLSLAINWVLFHDWFSSPSTIQVYQLGKSDLNEPADEEIPSITPNPEEELGLSLPSSNCTTQNGNLMLINPNFVVDTGFIQARQQQLISASQNYGIQEYNPQGNGDNLMIPEAAEHLNEMLAAYRAANPGHEMGTYSCFRARGTTCGRLCAATGTSDHHTGLTCDLIDLAYGSVLDTDDYDEHLEWQWLRENSYKYGFIDRFPAAWAGGLMSEPLNVDESGSTGLFETWHYRYVGVTAATEIATGKYNNGQYDSLEHYLKATGKILDLKNGICASA